VVRREFAKLLKKANTPRIRFHDLRHTTATLLFAHGIHPKVVREMLGHSAIAITLSLHGYVTPPMRKEAADTMDQIFEQDPFRGFCAGWRNSSAVAAQWQLMRTKGTGVCYQQSY
jgi:hypothetical protein